MIIFSRQFPLTDPEGCEEKWGVAGLNYLIMAIENLKVEAREKLVALYKQIGNISVTARRYGITRSALQRWIKRQYEAKLDRSHRPNLLGRILIDRAIYRGKYRRSKQWFH